MSQLVSRTSQTPIDLGVLSLAFWLRFEGHPPFDMVKRATLDRSSRPRR